MKYYEHDAQGWLIGWYDADTPRTNSTPTEPKIAPARARWNGTTWVSDGERETKDATDASAVVTRRAQVLATLRAYDPATATAADVRAALAAVIIYIAATNQ